jgi:hypothetical protein
MALSMCICMYGCPTYRDCSKEGGKRERAFCFPAIGKSRCIKIEKGCICGGCPVHKKMGFKQMFYCTKGSEVQQPTQ